MEDVVSLDDTVDQYYQHLEEGLVVPELLLENGNTDYPCDRQLFRFVVHAYELEDGVDKLSKKSWRS